MNYIEVKMTITGRIPVSDEDLFKHSASNIEEAARNQQRWYDQGTIDFTDILEYLVEIEDQATFIGVKESDE